MEPATNLIELPRTTKTIACSKCGKGVVVAERTVMVFCAECSRDMGKKL
jgi:ribosomal protein S27AE